MASFDNEPAPGMLVLVCTPNAVAPMHAVVFAVHRDWIGVRTLSGSRLRFDKGNGRAYRRGRSFLLEAGGERARRLRDAKGEAK